MFTVSIMISKTSVVILLTVATLTAYVTSAPIVTEDEEQMIKETINHFMQTNWQDHLVELRKTILDQYPEYLDILQKLHLTGDATSMSFVDAMHLMGYFTAVASGRLCYIKMDLQKRGIDFKPEDFENVGALIVADLKVKIPDMSAERAAAWDALIKKLADTYRGLGSCEDTDDDLDF